MATTTAPHLADTGEFDQFSDVPAIPRHLGSRILETVHGEIWRPASDVFEHGGHIIVHVDLPGIPRDAIAIETDDVAEVTIHGQIPERTDFKAASSRVRERGIKGFRKIVRLPSGCDFSSIHAVYKDGLLEVQIPYAGITGSGETHIGGEATTAETINANESAAMSQAV